MRLGIVGAGRMGRRVATAAAALAGVEVVVVIDPVDAGGIADEFDAIARTSIANATGLVDAVYIGAPNHLHARLCVEAASIGVDILVDKPLCLSAGEAKTIRDSVEAAGVQLMVGFSYRYRAEWRAARQWIQEGRIGTVALMIDTVAEASEDLPDWYSDPGRGGGVVQLQGHHCFDRARWVLGEEVGVIAALGDQRTGRGEMHATVLARSESGVQISVLLSLTDGYSAEGIAGCVLIGSRGHVTIDSVARTAVLESGGAVETVRGIEDDWLATELDAFVSLCAGESTLVEPGLTDGARAAELAERALTLLNVDRDGTLDDRVH